MGCSTCVKVHFGYHTAVLVIFIRALELAGDERMTRIVPRKGSVEETLRRHKRLLPGTPLYECVRALKRVRRRALSWKRGLWCE